MLFLLSLNLFFTFLRSAEKEALTYKGSRQSAKRTQKISLSGLETKAWLSKENICLDVKPPSQY